MLNLSVTYETDDIAKNYKIENVFDESYMLDVNEEPNHFHLLPISKIIKDFKSSEPIIAQNANKFWNLVESKIEYCLRLGAQSAYKNKLISKKDYEKYFISSE